MKFGDVMFGMAVTSAVVFFAYHNPFGFWRFWGLLALGVALAAVVTGILLFIINHQGLDNENGN